MGVGIGAMATTFLAELGQTEQALGEAGRLAEQLEAAGNIHFTEPRSVQLHLLAERGGNGRTSSLDQLVATARASGDRMDYALVFTAAAGMLLAGGHSQEAKALLAS